jgi:hypothetical protein
VGVIEPPSDPVRDGAHSRYHQYFACAMPVNHACRQSVQHALHDRLVCVSQCRVCTFLHSSADACLCTCAALVLGGNSGHLPRPGWMLCG